MENRPAGYHVLTVFAHDSDQGRSGNVEYDLIENSFTTYFIINKETGKISTTQTFDFEILSHTTFTFTVIAFDDGSPRKSSEAVIVVNIQDENDNCPVFKIMPTSYNVPLTSKRKVVIVTIEAHDADSDRNGQLEYEIDKETNPDQYFDIENNSGKLFVNRTLQPGKYALTIVTRDLADNPCIREIFLTLTVDAAILQTILSVTESSLVPITTAGTFVTRSSLLSSFTPLNMTLMSTLSSSQILTVFPFLEQTKILTQMPKPASIVSHSVQTPKPSFTPVPALISSPKGVSLRMSKPDFLATLTSIFTLFGFKSTKTLSEVRSANQTFSMSTQFLALSRTLSPMQSRSPKHIRTPTLTLASGSIFMSLADQTRLESTTTQWKSRPPSTTMLTSTSELQWKRPPAQTLTLVSISMHTSATLKSRLIRTSTKAFTFTEAEIWMSISRSKRASTPTKVETEALKLNSSGALAPHPALKSISITTVTTATGTEGLTQQHSKTIFTNRISLQASTSLPNKETLVETQSLRSIQTETPMVARAWELSTPKSTLTLKSAPTSPATSYKKSFLPLSPKSVPTLTESATQHITSILTQRGTKMASRVLLSEAGETAASRVLTKKQAGTKSPSATRISPISSLLAMYSSTVPEKGTPTTYKSFVIDVRLINRIFEEQLNNASSGAYQKLSKELLPALITQFRKIPGFLMLILVRFRNGSVIADFSAQFSVSNNNISTDLLRKSIIKAADTRGNIGDLRFDIFYLERSLEKTTVAPETNKEFPFLHSLAIIIGALVFIVIMAFVGYYIWRSRNSRDTNQQNAGKDVQEFIELMPSNSQRS